MAIRKATIHAKIEKAIEQLDKNRIDAAKATLAALAEKMDGSATVKRKPGKYALYMKAKFPEVRKKNPTLSMPEVMKKVAEEYRKSAK